MKLLFISRAFPPVIGGIENQNEALARHLSKQINCDQVVNRYGKKALPLFIPWAIILGSIKAKQADQILLGDGVAAIIGWFIKLFSNKPVACILHGLDITWGNSLYQKLWVNFFFNKIDLFIAVSQSTKAIAIKAGIPEEKISVIPNGVEKSLISPLSKKDLQKKLALEPENKFILLSLGRLVKRKGVLWFIENVAHKLPSNILYLIAGSGPQHEKILQAIKRLSLEKKVILLGLVDEQTKQSLFTHTDLFIQPNIPVENDVEGFGITQLEAGICGLPSISSNLEGIKDAIQEGKNGWLVEPSNADQLLRIILEKEAFLKSNKNSSSSSVQAHCIATFDWGIIAQQYIDKLMTFKQKKSHRAGFSPTTDRESKAKKILKVLNETRGTETKNLSVLDIGTGNGEISSFIGKKNNVTSVDIVDTRQANKDFSFSLCTEALPFKNNSFDVVISNHVIEHVQDQQLHISEIKRVLKKDGLLYFATPNKLWPFEVHYRIYFLHYLPHKLFMATLKKLNLYEENIKLLNLTDIKSLLKKSQLKSYSGEIIKNPSNYLMKTPQWLEKILNKIPIKVLNRTTFIHPTFIFIYKNETD